MPLAKKRTKHTSSSTRKKTSLPSTPVGRANGKDKRKIVIVTGLSGAGISSALKILEDTGYEIFDNFPLNFIDPLVAQDGAHKNPLAFALDTRSRGFSPEAILARIEALRANPDNDITLLFMTCSNGRLQKRFSETRRGHPLAKDRPVLDGIRQERGWLKPLMDAADLLIDTAELSVQDLRRQLESSIDPDPAKRRLTVTVMSFGFKNGVPRESDMVLDARFLANPHWDTILRPLTGKDKEVQDYVAKDPDFAAFLTHTESMLKLLLPRYADEGKYYFTLAVGCTGGRHRSVYLVERLSKILAGWGYNVSTRHRDLD